MEGFAYVLHTAKGDARAFAPVAPERTEAVRRFHSGLEGYAPTPLCALNGLAAKLGVDKVWVKDESKRFGLNAFKGLGGSFAIAAHLCGRLGIPLDEHAFARLTAPEAKAALGEITFVTATDGNHGRGVAWAARIFGHRSVVYLPKGSAQERLENIRAQGAQAEITPYIYDDTVRLAARMAQEHGWVLVQDTAWPGYEEIPLHIMQGYTTLAWEIENQLGGETPTHLFLQAGVGSMAGAIAGYFAARWGKERPKIIVVEPTAADCHYQTALKNDGELHAAAGALDSMMAGLCCGEVCTASWEILDNCADAFIACADEYSANGMCLLGRPEPGDPAIVSGESGAVPAGVLAGLMTREDLAQARRDLGLDANARVLVISTEGDTDRANYRRILEQA